MRRTASAGSRVRFSRSTTLAGSVWALLAVLSSGGLTWWYFESHRHPSPDRYRGLVLGLGWIGTILSMMAVALSARKRLAYQGIGRLSTWLSAHVYLGVVASCAVLLHTGFSAGSPLPTLLLAFFWMTAVSGLMGMWLSGKVPRLLTAIEEKPAIIEDLLEERTECLRGMLELAAAASPDFGDLVKKRLLPETGSWMRILRFYRNRSTFDVEIAAFQEGQERTLLRLGAFEHRAYQRAAEYALRINKLNAELFLHRVLRGWLTLHIAATAAMFGLLVLHVVSVLYY